MTTQQDLRKMEVLMMVLYIYGDSLITNRLFITAHSLCIRTKQILFLKFYLNLAFLPIQILFFLLIKVVA